MEAAIQTHTKTLHPTVIIAEKDLMLRATLAALLSCDGYRVFQEANENAALSCINSTNNLAVLFVDLDMPGWKSLVWHALNTTPDAFVIGISDSIPENADLEQFNIQVCLRKPVLYSEVQRALSETVKRRHAA